MKTPKPTPVEAPRSGDPEALPKRGLYDPPPGFNPRGMFWNGMCWQRAEIEHQEIEPQTTREDRR